MSKYFSKGRGAGSNPTSRFERLAYTPEFEDEASLPEGAPRTQLFRDTSRKILNENDSPDIEMKRGLNPYRGCEHGCIYCYARPTHEYLGLSSGLDFETKLFVKDEAPELLKKELSKKNYKAIPLAFSGITDPYQPVEKKLLLSRRCLEVLAETRHPTCMITKSAMITRDIDLLSELAEYGNAWVNISLTTLDHQLQRKLEPRGSTPQARLEAMANLREAGVKVGVNVSPVIPGLNDHEIPSILKAAAGAGAQRATWVLLRLPHSVKDLFVEWLREHEPLKENKVISKLKQLHEGKLYNSEFGTRIKGSGPLSEQIEQLFDIQCRKNGLSRKPMDFNPEAFRKPHEPQMDLFEGR